MDKDEIAYPEVQIIEEPFGNSSLPVSPADPAPVYPPPVSSPLPVPPIYAYPDSGYRTQAQIYAPVPTYPIARLGFRAEQNPSESDDPVLIQCPGCGHVGMTRIELINGCTVWTTCIMLGIVLTPLLFLPFYIRQCKDKRHRCENCGREVGYKPGGDECD